ncbi:gliding motility lipoprotein GldH [Zunongwangia sp. H14]|uniref:gliding motility lipoprotein GldH n=1 Tax=Zunongwangia sp. H14 TaxID=3240792 RepID=UPI0035698977
MRKAFFLLLGFLTICSLFSCDKERVFDEYKSVSTWNKDSVITFKLEHLDSVRAYNLFINIRNNNDYKYSNLFLITQLEFPHGKVISDTLEYEMAAPDGTWLGTGFGDVKESKLWYRENVTFPEQGVYEVRIKQAMRKNGEVEGIQNLEGITHVGFRIENSAQQ